MSVNLLSDYLDYIIICSRYNISSHLLQEQELSNLIELDKKLSNEVYLDIIPLLQSVELVQLLLTNPEYVERFHDLAVQYPEIKNYGLISNLSKLLELMKKLNLSIEEYSNEELYKAITLHTDQFNKIESILFLYFIKSNFKIKDDMNLDLILSNFTKCIKVLSSSRNNKVEETCEFILLVDTISQKPYLFTSIHFTIFTDLCLSNLPTLLKALQNDYLLSMFTIFDNIGFTDQLYLTIDSVYKLSLSLNQDTFMMFTKIADCLTPENELLVDFLINWEKVDYSKNCIEIFYNKVSKTNLLDYTQILKNQMTFLSFLYKERYYDIILGLNNVSTACSDLIIYSLVNNKKRFLELLLMNSNISIENIGKYSILFCKDFYQKYFNLDSLDEKVFAKLLNILEKDIKIDKLETNRVYTLNEILLLKAQNDRYYSFYHMLNELPIDKRILITKQLKKYDLLGDNWDNNFEDKLELLASGLSEMTVYDWMHNKFNHIPELSILDTVKLIMLYKDYSELIDTLQTMVELNYLILNFKNIDSSFNFELLKKNFIQYDPLVKQLFTDLNLDNIFIDKYYNNIYQFWLNNGVNMYFKYKSRSDNRSLYFNNFKLIIKAELAGKFKEIKYYSGDLEKEILFPQIPETTIAGWKADLQYSNDQILIKECDDFFSIFNMGVTPVKTCLHYEEGSYFDCLIANFDSNKKLINIYEDNILIGHAILRFTKYTNKDIVIYQDLGFRDVTDTTIMIKEDITLFLEKVYFTNISRKLKDKCISNLLNFLKLKSEKMNRVNVLLSSYYDTYLEQHKDIVENTKYAIYIAHSKSDIQYLDSFNGITSRSDEGKYIPAKCYKISSM